LNLQKTLIFILHYICFLKMYLIDRSVLLCKFDNASNSFFYVLVEFDKFSFSYWLIFLLLVIIFIKEFKFSSYFYFLLLTKFNFSNNLFYSDDKASWIPIKKCIFINKKLIKANNLNICVIFYQLFLFKSYPIIKICLKLPKNLKIIEFFFIIILISSLLQKLLFQFFISFIPKYYNASQINYEGKN